LLPRFLPQLGENADTIGLLAREVALASTSCLQLLHHRGRRLVISMALVGYFPSSHAHSFLESVQIILDDLRIFLQATESFCRPR
jgi:hypothetical protein